jgi:exodeoxyribonuclease VII large subunit
VEQRKIFSLSKLTIALENHFMEHFGLRTYWVTAEIVKVNSKSGHYYLELADSKDERTTALCNATLWAIQQRIIQQKIGDEFFQIIKAGNNALLEVKIEYHSIYGLKLNIIAIDPNYTYGDIERRKKETIQQLQQEGLYDLQKQLKLPVICKRIALVGSPETSGFRDFKDELLNNEAYRNFVIKEFPTSVQGDGAKKEIINALTLAQQYDVDTIVLIRGGGSKMDLDIFNDYRIAKTICTSKIPVLTGIGHETDEVVADLVANDKFITPTAVGKFLWVRIREFRFFMTQYYNQIIKKSMELLAIAKDEFYHKNKYLVHYTQNILQDWKETFSQLSHQINKKSQQTVHLTKEELIGLSYFVQRSLNKHIQHERYAMDELLTNIKHTSFSLINHEREVILIRLLQQTANSATNSIHTARLQLSNSADLLKLLNPEKVLNRGYTITTFQDEDIDKIAQLKAGDEIKTLSAKTIIISKITAIKQLKNGRK